jgi:hypothetical protein
MNCHMQIVPFGVILLPISSANMAPDRLVDYSVVHLGQETGYPEVFRGFPVPF